MCPWELLASASTFISVMGAYSVFLGPMCGIQICDYFLIKKQRVKLSDLYRPSPSGIYYFVKGVNPRAFVAWVLGWASQLPGFIATVNPNITIPKGCMDLYYLAFPLGFAISFGAYYGICRMWPPRGAGEFDDVDYYATFTDGEAQKLGVAPLQSVEEIKVGDDGTVTPDLRREDEEREKELGAKISSV